ncbi:hypothetical protein [Rhodopila globiformis]|uniref:hypothetical protein n=1 Tax=Rhodopila globiformis TaxID=1071 RepID=UPI0011AFD5DE|nr:hypothetical protein [Rhodopila globiformis]
MLPQLMRREAVENVGVQARQLLAELQRHLVQTQTEEYCRSRRRCPRCGAQRPPLRPRQQLALDRRQHRREAAVLLQPFQVGQAVAAGQVHEDQRQHHLQVQPALRADHRHELADRCDHPAGTDQIEIQRSSSQGGQASAARLGLILEVQHTLRQHSSSRWGSSMISKSRRSP